MTQGISIAVPASWIPINYTKETIQSAAQKDHVGSVSASTFIQEVEAAQKLHEVIVSDVKSAVNGRFTRTLNAFCDTSNVPDAGSAGIPFIKMGAVDELEKAGATHITQKDLKIGGVPGVETSSQLSSSRGTIYNSQLEVLPRPQKACFVTVSVGRGQSDSDVLSVAAATAEFP